MTQVEISWAVRGPVNDVEQIRLTGWQTGVGFAEAYRVQAAKARSSSTRIGMPAMHTF